MDTKILNFQTSYTSACKSRVCNAPPMIYKSKEFVFSPMIRIEPVNETQIHVRISNWKIQPSCIEMISFAAPSHDLHEVTFVNCGLTSQHLDVIIASLLPQSSIRVLNINHTPINVAWATLLDFPLIRLSLRGNSINDVQATAIAAQLKTNRTLIALNLCRNNIGRAGAEAIADGLKHNSCLLHLSMASNLLTDEAVHSIAKSLKLQPLSVEEVAIRKNFYLEHEKMRVIEEETLLAESTAKKKPGKAGQGGRAGSGEDKSNKKDQKSATTQPKKAVQDQKLQKKGKQVDSNSLLSDKQKKPQKKEPTPGSPEEADDNVQMVVLAPSVDMEMIEINNMFFASGNRSLAHLNIRSNKISGIGLKHLSDAISEQNFDELPVGSYTVHGKEYCPQDKPRHGMLRLFIENNLFSSDDALLQSLDKIFVMRLKNFEAKVSSN